MSLKKTALRIASLFLLFVLFFPYPALATEPEFGEGTETVILRGIVVSVEDLEPEDSTGFVNLEQLAEVRITGGRFDGKIMPLLNQLMGHPLFDLYLTKGRRVILWGEVDLESGELRHVYLQDYVRDVYLYLLAGLFVLVMLVIGRRKGLYTVVTLSLTVLAIFKVLLPMLLAGYSPIAATVAVAAVVSLVTVVAISGLHRKTLAAVIGTVGGVLVAGLLSLLVGNLTRLTGFSSEEAQMLAFMEGGPLDVRGLLFAGIIIGSLGAVMDVAVSISSAVHEVYCADRNKCASELFISAMNVGRDVMGTMANTLILAYVGTAAPLLLLFMGYGTPWVTIINSDLVATEVVRALAGSIGLICAIPLTAAAASFLMVRAERRKAPRSPGVES